MTSRTEQVEKQQERRILCSRTAKHAIRALIHLAQLPKGAFATNGDIARAEDLPGHHLSKILQYFARTGILRSVKGRAGGFALDLDPRDIRLLDIVGPLDGLVMYRRCITGPAKCSDDMPCFMHDGWVSLRSEILAYMEGTTIADLARALEQKRKAIGTARRAKARHAARKRVT
jgi:Rrf2 family protein